MAREVYQLEGAVDASVGAVTGLIIGVSVATLVLIFMGVLGGQVYSNTQADIEAINNSEIKGYVTDAITNAFKAQSMTGKYLPIIVLAVIIFLVLGLITGLGQGTAAGYYGGYGGYGGFNL